MTKQSTSKKTSNQPQESEATNNPVSPARRTTGFILVALGVFFLFGTFTNFEFMGKLWPLILVAIGLGIVLGRGK